MSNAWEVTPEDVMQALDNLQIPYDEDKVDEVLDLLDLDRVEKEALRGDDMNEQTEYALREIEDQILNMDIDN